MCFIMTNCYGIIIVMKKFLSLLLLSPLAVSNDFNSDSAEEIAIKNLDKLTSLKPECVSFYFEGRNETKTKFWFEIRELHNKDCGGDPYTAPIIASVYVTDTKEIFVYNLICNDYYLIDDYSWDMDCN